MQAKNTNIEQLHRALEAVNRQFAGNVIFNRGPEYKRGQLHFTLRVKDSSGPGSRRGYHNRQKRGGNK